MSDQFQRLSTMGFKKDPWVRFGKTKWFKAEEDDPRLERAFLSLCDSTLGAYKSTLRQLDGWLNGRELTNERLAIVKLVDAGVPLDEARRTVGL